MWYKQPLEISFWALRHEINFPFTTTSLPFHSRAGSLGIRNLTSLVLQSMLAYAECNQSIPSIMSKSTISNSTRSQGMTRCKIEIGHPLKTLQATIESPTGLYTE